MTLACPNPECCSGKTGIYFDPANSLRPSTWGGCCSPECGAFVDGLAYAAPDHPAVRSAGAMADVHERWEIWVRAEVESCPGHEWSVDPRRYVTVYSRDGSTVHDGLKCDLCPARKTGDPR